MKNTTASSSAFRNGERAMHSSAVCLTAPPPVRSLRHQQEEPGMSVPFAPGSHSQHTGPHEEPPASHVGSRHPFHPVGEPQTGMSGDGTVAISAILKDVHVNSDVLPERVRPKGEPSEESETPPAARGGRKRRRRRVR